MNKQATEKNPNASGKDTHFLYVEDDALSQQVMGMLVTKLLGYNNLTIFKDSQNFEERLNALPTPPDVIFLDIHIQPYNGYELLRMIRANSRYDNAIIIALTASVMSNEVETLRQAGFKNLIGKPINAITFPKYVNELLAGRSVWDASWA